MTLKPFISELSSSDSFPLTTFVWSNPNSYATLGIYCTLFQIFSSEGCWYSVSEALQILGGLGYMKDYPTRGTCETAVSCFFEGTNEILRMYVALTCMQHAGKELQETLRICLKSLSKRVLYRMGVTPKVPVFHEDDATHPTLKESADELSKSITVFGFSVESILAKYKREQMVLKRVADVLIDIYAMTAVLSRATRSISWGCPIMNTRRYSPRPSAVRLQRESNRI
ncbi:putative acyl-CoA dehydrogenase family member 9, mitochondrial [Apostichopus japonicus]|uniref:Putative acyl-CoA dehydrogenase family member 9, mitochondrial n=1 Tax=Stichopus japonicus TaxID=307972 RepID=A0A2G8KM40_STIJA|nr:putative acyl-CoA dehydrogenase family member 9, mitochondrial [Apostichopus japonicus]